MTKGQQKKGDAKFSSVELEKKAKEMLRVKVDGMDEAPDRYFLLVCTEVDSRNSTVVGLETDYNEALLKLHTAYQHYLNDDEKFIVRQTSQTEVMVFKRNIGYFFNSKHEYLIFKIIAYQC